MRKGEITLSIESQFGNVFLVGLAVNRIASFAEASEQSAFEMEVAVVEAVNNAVEHAHRHQRDKLVTVRVRLASDRINFVIIDHGAPIDFKMAIAASARPKSPSELERGRGLTIIRQLMDEVKWRRQGKTNQLTLVKYLKSASTH